VFYLNANKDGRVYVWCECVYACTMCYNMFTNVCIKIQDNNLRNKSKTNKNN